MMLIYLSVNCRKQLFRKFPVGTYSNRYNGLEERKKNSYSSTIGHAIDGDATDLFHTVT